LHLAVSGTSPATTLRNPSYLRVIDATVQTQEAQTGAIALARLSPVSCRPSGEA